MMDYIAHVKKPNCYNCIYLKAIWNKMRRERDDGGVHWKYLYKWYINCKKEGVFNVELEGTANMCEVPHCSLWVNRNE